MSSHMFSMMLDYPPAIAAKRKLGAIPDDFAFYEYEWLDQGRADVMKVTGAVFREAKRGPRVGKGKCMPVTGTKRVIYVTQEEIQDARMEPPK